MNFANKVNNCKLLSILTMSEEKQESKPTMMELFINYLKTTSPLLLLIHLIYIMVVCATLSFSYVVAFHWSNLIQIYQDAHDVKSFSKNLKISVEQDNQINDTLYAIMSQTNGYRAYVYRYHNGLAAISSVPFFFQTNTHEVIAPGAARLLPYEQRMPASINPLVSNQYIKNACATVTDTDSDKNNQFSYVWQTRKAKAFIRCPIYLDNGDLFGFVGVDYSENPIDVKKYQGLIIEAAKNIGNIFEVIQKK